LYSESVAPHIRNLVEIILYSYLEDAGSRVFEPLGKHLPTPTLLRIRRGRISQMAGN